MKSTISATALLGLACLISAAPAPSHKVEKRAYTTGIDVSDYQGASPNWSGSSFAYIKATEGTTYTNPNFASQYNGAYDAGLIRGSYHFAHPDSSTGAAQATYFVNNGGGWSADGATLPGALDIEYNPSGAECYGLGTSDMVAWINDFTTTYSSLTGTYPVIYTTTDWWTTCTGNSPAFGSTSPLWIARYSSSVGTLPAGWSDWSFWQYSDSSIDEDYWNGDAASLEAFATS